MSTHNNTIDGGWCICSLDPKQWWWSIKRPVSPEQHQAAHSRRVPEQSWGLLIIRHIVWGRHGDSAQMLKIAPKCSAAAAWLLPVRKCFFSVGGAAAGGWWWSQVSHGEDCLFCPSDNCYNQSLADPGPSPDTDKGWSVLLCNNNYNYKVWTVSAGNQLQRWRPDRAGVWAGIMLTLQQIVLTAVVCLLTASGHLTASSMSPCHTWSRYMSVSVLPRLQKWFIGQWIESAMQQ